MDISENPPSAWQKAREKEPELGHARENHYLSLQGDYGKWLVASLLLMNGGGIVAFARSGIALSDNVAVTLVALLVGLFLSLVCGLFTWANWRIHAEVASARNDRLAWKAYFAEFDGHDEYISEFHDDASKKSIKEYLDWRNVRYRWIMATYYGSLIVGISASIPPVVALSYFVVGLS